MVEHIIPRNPTGSDKKSPNGIRQSNAAMIPMVMEATPSIFIF